MSEFINHVPNAAEAAQWAVESRQPEVAYHLDFGGAEYSISQAEEFIGGLQAEANDQRLAQSVGEIVRQGTDNGQSLEPCLVSRNADDQLDCRETLASWKVRQPAIYEAITAQNVVGFHGTRSATLAGLLEHGGLMSTRHSTGLGDKAPVMTAGEHIYQSPEGQKGVSFSNLAHLDSAGNYAGSGESHRRTPDEVVANLDYQITEFEKYARQFEATGGKMSAVMRSAAARIQKARQEFVTKPDSLASVLMKHDFPVMVGIDGTYIAEHPYYEKRQSQPGTGDASTAEYLDDRHRQVWLGVGDMGEFRPVGQFIPTEALPVVAVPAERVESVQTLFKMHETPVTVVPIEDLLAGSPAA